MPIKELIADARHFAAKQPRELVESSESPNPMMQEPRHGAAAEEGRKPDRGP